MERALKEQYWRESSKMRMENFTKNNYPMASSPLQKNLLAKKLMSVEYNETQFLSRKPH